MKRLSFLVSLTNNDNDYQQEQAAAAEKAARRLGVDVTSSMPTTMRSPRASSCCTTYRIRPWPSRMRCS